MILQNFVVFEGIDGTGTSTQIELLKKSSRALDFHFTAEPSASPIGKFIRQILSGQKKLCPQAIAFLFAADRAEHLWGNSEILCNEKSDFVLEKKSGSENSLAKKSNGEKFSNEIFLAKNSLAEKKSEEKSANEKKIGENNFPDENSPQKNSLAKNSSIEKIAKSGKIVVSDRYFFSSLAYQSIDCGENLPQTLNSFFPLPSELFYFELPVEIALERIKKRSNLEIYETLEFLTKTAAAYKKIIAAYENSAPEMKITKIDAQLSPQKIHKIICKKLGI